MVMSNTSDFLIDNTIINYDNHQIVDHCYTVPITIHDIQQKNNICKNNESVFIDSGTQTVQSAEIDDVIPTISTRINTLNEDYFNGYAMSSPSPTFSDMSS
ncbi:hypothetical protein HCN44_007964 [Aphidius gifuensis]|uniref:Uncharacterized protein n=1 Tax=Aphidius gifuensis TaxID=684658 RepID=A0A834XPW3_APHGI|nr:hypothetical protein HCN44_007964 [Aphidius gifuensis]